VANKKEEEEEHCLCTLGGPVSAPPADSIISCNA